MRAVYCKCLNTYSIKCAENDMVKNCDAPDYWKQGIGRIYALDIIGQENGEVINQENNYNILV
jgi:hypothetical protein